ncbi:MAG: glycosyl hydrolase 115 family protein [Terricaulis sp.]
MCTSFPATRRTILQASAALAALSAAPALAIAEEAFPVIADGRYAPIIADVTDFSGVLRAVRSVTADLAAMTGETQLGVGPSRSPTAIIVGTLGRNAVIDRLVSEGKLDASGVTGRWEAFVHQVVERPMRGVNRALVIAGADKRGTIFGLYDLAERIGISPWVWWADVPIPRRNDVSVPATRRVDEPRVKYRGIFLNDEEPALGNWAREKFGGINHAFYERVFELILRLKGNYLWPAMWGKAIYDDDPVSPELADEMGVVLGTSHHEPLTRAHVEWERYGEGTPWDYARNEERLRAFWRAGIERMGDNESLVTVGMRGDGDEPMSQGTAISLLERIVRDQRQIIADVTGKPASETPQIWALYKEVQDYYDQGMQVPDDVTLLFADDNWGNIRRLPDLGAPARAGGYGIYYHFDYVGGPRNYKWLNTNQIERVWEQMQLARQYGADRVWIVNVGDLKPMEFPINFFMDMTWNPEAMLFDGLADYARAWAARQFGEEHAPDIGYVLTRYGELASRRKPELLAPDTFSLQNFTEAERVLGQWRELEAAVDVAARGLAPEAQSAFFQLVAHPVLANRNQHELYVAAGRNHLWAEQGRVSANVAADEVEALFARDQAITAQYHALNGGKWNHMMSQTHIGYTIWQQPETNIIPETRRITPRAGAAMGVAIEGDARAFPARGGDAVLPEISRYGGPQTRWIDVFNRGTQPFRYSADVGAPWIELGPCISSAGDPPATEVHDQVRLCVSVDWLRAPEGRHRVPITLQREGGGAVTVYADIFNPVPRHAVNGFVEANGYVAIAAEHYTAAVDANGVTWWKIPHLGVAAFPRSIAPIEIGADTPRLEYQTFWWEGGDVNVHATFAPTMNFTGRGLRYGVSLGNEAPRIVNVHVNAEGEVMHSGESDANWERWVANNANVQTTRHHLDARGQHTLRIWLIDPGLVLERVLVVRGDLPPSYLGPPESVSVYAESTP